MEPQLPAPSGKEAIYHKYLKTQIHRVKQLRLKFKNEPFNFTKTYFLCKLSL